MISQLVYAKALYSASADDLDTTTCFFDFQLIKESPMNTQKSVIDLQVSGHEAQSESLYPLRCKEDFEEKKILWLTKPLTHLVFYEL